MTGRLKPPKDPAKGARARNASASPLKMAPPTPRAAGHQHPEDPAARRARLRRLAGLE